VTIFGKLSTSGTLRHFNVWCAARNQTSCNRQSRQRQDERQDWRKESERRM